MSDAEQEYGTHQVPDEDRHDESEPSEPAAPRGDEQIDPMTPEPDDLRAEAPPFEVTGMLRPETMEADEAFAFRDSLADDPTQTAVLMPTMEAIIDARRRPEDTLESIRTLTDSIDLAIGKALQIDVMRGDTHGAALSGTARMLEGTLVDLYGSEPTALARVLMQSRLDDVLSNLLGTPDDETDAPADTTTEREPAAPVEPESTRPANEHEVADALSTVENVVWGLAIDTMPGGVTRFTLSEEQDAHVQSWLAAVAMDAAEQSIQEAGVGNGVDRLRAIRGILSLALAHVGEAIQTLEPDATQIGTSTAANGIEHEIRLGKATR